MKHYLGFRNHRTIVLIALFLCILSFHFGCESKSKEEKINADVASNSVTLNEAVELNDVIDNQKGFGYENFLDSIKISQKDSLKKKHGINLLKMSFLLLKYENDYPKSLSYFNRFKSHPSAKNFLEEIEIFYDLSVCSHHIISNNRKESRALFEETKKKLSTIENIQLKYFSKQIEGNLLCIEYQYNKGIDILLEVYEATKKNPDLQINKYTLLNSIAIYLMEIKKYDQAMDFLVLAHKESTKARNNEALVMTYSNIGNVLSYQGKHEASIDTFLKAININKKTNKKSNNINIYYNIGLSYTERENYAKAAQYFTKGIELSEEINYEIGLCYNYYGMGYNYYKSKNYANAIKYLTLGIEYSKKYDNKPILFNCIKDLISIAKLQNDSKTVLKYFDEFQSLQEDYQEYVLNEQVEEMVLKMDLEKINAKNKLLSQEIEFKEKINREKNILIYTETFIVVLILIFVILLSGTIRKKQKINLALELQKKETENVTKISSD